MSRVNVALHQTSVCLGNIYYKEVPGVKYLALRYSGNLGEIIERLIASITTLCPFQTFKSVYRYYIYICSINVSLDILFLFSSHNDTCILLGALDLRLCFNSS